MFFHTLHFLNTATRDSPSPGSTGRRVQAPPLPPRAARGWAGAGSTQTPPPHLAKDGEREVTRGSFRRCVEAHGSHTEGGREMEARK